MRTINRVRPLLGKQLGTDVSPERLFGREQCAMVGPFDEILFVSSHASPQIEVRPVKPEEVARRMVFSLQDEQARLQEYYWKYRFAFPDRPNSILESSLERQQEALHRLLEGKRAFDVRHPHPFSIPELFEALQKERP